MKRVFWYLLGTLITILMLPVIIGATHLWGNRPEETSHSTVILMRNLMHLCKTLVFFILSGVLFLLVIWIQN